VKSGQQKFTSGAKINSDIPQLPICEMRVSGAAAKGDASVELS